MHWLYFSIATLCWGGSFLAIRIAVTHMHPFLAAALRVATALFWLALYLFWKKRKIPLPPRWYEMALCGWFGMGFAWIFLFWGEQHIAPALAAVINSSVPILTTLLAPIITPKDRHGWGQRGGVLLGAIGVGIIFVPELSTPVTQHTLGILAIAGMAVSYAIGILWTRRLTYNHTGGITNFYQCLGAEFVLFSAYGLSHEGTVWDGAWQGLAAIFYLGTFSTALAGLLFFRMIKDRGSVQASASVFCVPVVAILLDAIFLKQFLKPYQLAGAAVILLAVTLTQKKVPT